MLTTEEVRSPMKIPFAKFIHLNLSERIIEIVFGITLLFMVLGIAIGTAQAMLEQLARAARKSLRPAIDAGAGAALKD